MTGWNGEDRRRTATLTDDQFRQIKRLAIVAITLFVLGLGYSTWNSYARSKTQRDVQVAGCERGKVDRRDSRDGQKATANFKRAYVTYNKAVTGAASVKEDVKGAARVLRVTVKDSLKTLDRTSKSLASRTGPPRPGKGAFKGETVGLDCNAIPEPSLLP